MIRSKHWRTLSACTALVLVAAAISGCGGAGGSGTQTNVSKTIAGQTVVIFLKQKPRENVMSVRLELRAVSLNSANSRVDLISAPRGVEFQQLALAPRLAFVNTGLSAGTYSSMTFEFGTVELSVADARGNIQKVSSTSTPSVSLARQSVTLPANVVLAAQGTAGVIVNFDLTRSISTTANGNFVIDPVLQAFAADANSEAEMRDTLGTISQLSTANRTFTFTPIRQTERILVRVPVSAGFDPDLGTISALRDGQIIRLVAKFQTDGSVEARFISSGPVSASAFLDGVVTFGKEESSGFFFDLVVLD